MSYIQTQVLNLLRLVWISFRDAAWAPILVLLFRCLTQFLGIRPQLDHVIHYSGGFAIAYFFYRTAKIFRPFIGNLISFTRYLLAFTMASTVALFWEFGEFAKDIFTGSHIQYSVSETLWDLVYGVFGVASCLIFIAIINWFKFQIHQRQS